MFDIYPPGSSSLISSNESSLIVILQHGDIRMVLPGDAEENRVLEMLEYPVSPCDLYKLPHHGRDNYMSAKAIEYLQPRIAVVTAKSVKPLTQAALASIKSQVFSTAQGTILAESDGRMISVDYVE